MSGGVGFGGAGVPRLAEGGEKRPAPSRASCTRAVCRCLSFPARATVPSPPTRLVGVGTVPVIAFGQGRGPLARGHAPAPTRLGETGCAGSSAHGCQRAGRPDDRSEPRRPIPSARAAPRQGRCGRSQRITDMVRVVKGASPFSQVGKGLEAISRRHPAALASPFASCDAPFSRARPSSQSRWMSSLLSGRRRAVPFSRSR